MRLLYSKSKCQVTTTMHENLKSSHPIGGRTIHVGGTLKNA